MITAPGLVRPRRSIPILFYSTINLIRQSQTTGRSSSLYPRIDLCNNQLERYVDYAYHLKESVKASTFTEQIVNHNKNMSERWA